MQTPGDSGGLIWTPAEIAAVRRALLAFFDAHARSLPWRGAADPYRVWVSEMMLQQTRVETVIPYYERWLARFPDLQTLAASPLDDVLHAWQGLGYYSRARHLHQAARTIRERHGGVLPHDTATLRALPGVGEYTAGAVASIAYGRAEPAVDGNVRRVLARLRDVPAPRPAWLRTAAGALVPSARPGDFNQALMELGATICLPRAPRCGACPISELCAARLAGTQHERPARRATALLPTARIGVAAVFDACDRLLLVQRPPGSLLGGMWVLPGAELRDGERGACNGWADEGDDQARERDDETGERDDETGERNYEAYERAARRAVAMTLGDGTRLERVAEIGRFEHTFSHRRELYEVIAFRARTSAAARGGRERGAGRGASGEGALAARAAHTFSSESGLAGLALARATVRIAAACFAWRRG